MKKILKAALLILFVSLLAYFGYKIITKIKHKKQIAHNIKTIPVFSFEKTQGGVYTNKNLIANQATLFIYYNSQCEFCNEEAKMIRENITKFANIQIVFVSYENTKQIIAFAKTHQLYNYDNITFLSDTKMSFSAIFDVKSLPCLILYDRNKQLIEKIKGQVNVETLLKQLQTTN